MLKNAKPDRGTTTRGRFVIVASEYNAKYVDGMLKGAVEELESAGAEPIRVVRVPGAYEIPLVAKHLAKSLPPPSAVICLGLVLRGKTAHAEHVGDAVNQALMRIQLEHEVPVINSVHLMEDESHARVRCLGKRHNRGREAAQTAMAMAQVMSEL